MPELHSAALASDVEAVRKLLQEKASINERDENHQTPLMHAACKGDLEIAWMLVDGGADVKCKDKTGATALSMARTRGFTEITDLLGGAAQAPADAGGPLMPDDFSSDEEPEAVDTSPAVVLDHVVKLQTSLGSFSWEQYEAGLAKLAGVATEDVFVTPEPGNSSIEAHATIIKRLKTWEVTSTEGIDEIMKTVKALRLKERLTKAANGAAPLALAEVKLIGEGADCAEAMAKRVTELKELRAEYNDLKVSHSESHDPKAKALAASKAILLLRPGRDAMVAEAAKSRAAVLQRQKRQGGNSVPGMGSTVKGPLSMGKTNRR